MSARRRGPRPEGDGPARGEGRRPSNRPDVPRGAATAPDGLLLVDKPAGLSSHDVVALTRRMCATRKVGHAGTLDPMATGLLLLGIGRATRFLAYLVGADKAYTATARLGQTTLTEDAEGETTSARGCSPEDLDGRLAPALAGLRGDIEQVPSAVSAIKVDGVRSYARVRGGEDVALAPRPVTIGRLEAIGEPRPGTAEDGTPVVDVDLDVECSSGTYVRALARDLGEALGCGAHLTALRRTAVGPFEVPEARSIEALAAEAAAGADVPGPDGGPRGIATMPLADIARRIFPVLELDEPQARALSYGQALPAEALDGAVVPEGAIVRRHRDAAGKGQEAAEDVVAALAPDGRLVALLAKRGRKAQPVLVLAPA